MAELIPDILAHALGGVVLAAIVWGLGLGALVFVAPGLTEVRARAHAYPVGLGLATVAAGAFLISAWLAVISVPLLLVPLAGLARVCDLRSTLQRALPAVPGAAGLGIALGFLLHAPTSRLDSNAYGDMLFYVSKQVSAAHSLLPFRDYLVEGERGTYIESAPTFVGGALSHAVPLDVFLFQATLLPAFLLTAMAIGFALTSPSPRVGMAWVGLLLLSTAAYPTWLTESAPVAMALPLAFSLHALYRERVAARTLTVLAVVLAFDLVLTKGLALLTLAAVIAVAVTAHHRGSITRKRALVVGAAALAAVALAIAAFVSAFGWLTVLFHTKVLPVTAYHGLHSQFTVRSTQEFAPALEVAGQLALVALLLRARLFRPLVVLVVGIAATWFVGGHGLDITIGMAIALAALSAVEAPDAMRREWPLLAAAAVLLALSTWFRDISGIRASFVFCALFVAATLAVVVPWSASRAAGAVAVTSGAVLAALGSHPALAAVLVAAALAATRVPRLAAPAVVAACAAGIALAVAAGSGFGLTSEEPTLTTADYGVWQAARRVVPSDGLVFTSLTGNRISGYEGWDYYPGLVRRQVYLAGWSDSPLLVQTRERRRRLTLNEAVLQGTTPPSSLELSRDYSSFFAVVRRGEHAPSSFRRLYANDRFALYRIES